MATLHWALMGRSSQVDGGHNNSRFISEIVYTVYYYKMKPWRSKSYVGLICKAQQLRRPQLILTSLKPSWRHVDSTRLTYKVQ